MSELTMGIPYFGVQTDIKDDDKIFELKYRFATADGQAYDNGAAYAAFGRFIDLLASIYCEGFAAKVTLQRKMRMSQQLGLSMSEFDHFLQECVDVGLFDRDLWERERVLTSTGMQKRYFTATARRHGWIPEEQREWLLVQPPEHQISASNGVEVSSLQQQEGFNPDEADEPQQDCSDSNTREEKKKRREEKVKKSKEEEEEKIDGAQTINDESSRISRLFTRHLDSRPKKLSQPYPLSCFGITDGEHVFDDGMGNMLETPWDAITTNIRCRAPDADIGEFARQVVAGCPADCSESMERVCECHALMSRALEHFDRRKCANPIPLICKVLKEDRKGGDG